MPRLDNKTEFVAFVKAETKRQGRTLIDVCREAGVNTTYIHRCKDHKSLQMDAAIAILNTLGVHLEIMPNTVDTAILEHYTPSLIALSE